MESPSTTPADAPQATGTPGRSDSPGRSVLFLQTDWEMGSCRLARQMRSNGHAVYKVAFHTADYYFRLWGVPVRPFRGKVEEWRSWLEAVQEELGIDTVVLYNNKRTYNAIAEELADAKGIEVIIIEQGLVRPLHVTAYSTREHRLREIADLWRQVLKGTMQPEGYGPLPPQTVPVSSRYKFLRFAFFGSISALTRSLFPNYREQQKVGLFYHAAAQARGLWRICRSALSDRKIESLVSKNWTGRFFLVPLQVPYDKQVVLLSEFADINEFIDAVADSFERGAHEEDRLIFKVHPVDRGYRDYDEKIDQWKARLGEDRVHLIDWINLDRLLENARGVVTINSTVGLTALRHGTPVKVLGEAIYDLPELTYSGRIDDFWMSEKRPCTDTVQEFVRLLESTIQGRGTLSRKCFPDAGETGIIWPKNLCKIFGFREY